MRIPIRQVIETYIGGGWGKEAPDRDHIVPASVIRGTDLNAVQEGIVDGVPCRWHKEGNARSRLLLPGDIIFEVSGGSKDQPVGRSLLLDSSRLSGFPAGVIPASFCKKIRPDKNKINPRVLLANLQLAWSDRRIVQWQVQSTGISNFNFEAFLDDFCIELPSLVVQERIAEILSSYDRLIENSQRRTRILDAMVRSIYREWFVHFRYPGRESVPMISSAIGEIPQGWVVEKLGSLADIGWGDTSTTKSSYVDEGYVAYSASGADGKLDHYDFDREGVVLSAIGAQCGKTWFARGKWSCIKNTIRFWSKSDFVSTEFLFFATQGQGFWPRRGAAQPFISQGDSERLDILVPDPMAMRRFTVFAAALLEQMSALEKKIENLRRTRDLLLPRLLSGQIDLEAA